MRKYNSHANNIKSNNIVSLLVLILALCLTLCMITWGGGASRLNNSAEALTSTSGAVKAGNGEELWNGYNFNPIVINDLRTKLFGTDDPVSYIKANGADDYNTYGKISASPENNIPYYVVRSSTINANPRVNSTDNGMIVCLDGKEWMVASLTLADIEGKENVVLTLYLADNLGTSKYYSDGSNTRGNNAYSKSIIRNHLLTDSNWSLYNTTTAGSFAKQYLVQPKYVQYQHTETVHNRKTDLYHFANCALGELTSGWNPYFSWAPSDSLVDDDGNTVRYDDWGNDYIWLPSIVETGTSSYSYQSIWGISASQRNHSQDYTWLRNGDYTIGSKNSYGLATLLNSTGAYNNSKVSDVFSVRPAIHLNLTAAGLGTVLDDPQNVSATYNGDVQTVKSVVDAKPTEYPWYDSAYYENSNRITLSFQDAKGNPVTEMKNAGTYWVKADMANWVKEVDDQIDAESAGWSADEIAAAKEVRRPKFKGTADTSDSLHKESATVRWFKFTIKPAELDIPTVAEASKPYTGSNIAFTMSGYDSAKMTATPPAGYTLSDDGKISFKNAKTYAIDISIKDNNYCWKGTSSNPDRSAQTINITVTRKDLSVQFKSSKSDNKFTMAVGENVTFSVIPTNAAKEDTVELILTYLDGGTEKQSTDNTLNASGLSTGTYTLGVKLVDKEGTANSNYVIKNNPTQDFVIGSNKINIESVTWQYAQDGEPTEISGDSVVLTYNGKEFRFTLKDTADELKAKGVKIDSYTDNVQKNATDGAVTVKVKLVPYDESFEFSDNKTEVEFSLTVTINRAKIDFTKLVWSAAPTNQLEYTGNNQTVTIVSGIPSFYDVAYRDNSGLLVDTYTTKILSIIAKTDPESVAMAANYSVEDSDYASYTYTWEIVRKKIEAKWTNVAHTTTDGKTVYIPEITGAGAGVLKYEYTTDPDGETKELSDILSSYSETQISYYKVTVTIDSAYAASYELVNSAFVVQPSASKNFAVGNNKKSVTVSLQETKVYFNNQPQAVKLNCTGEGIILGDFAVEYKLLNADGSEGEATNVAPSAVGKYKVTITLQGEKANTHIIVGENVFEYVIAHKDRFILTAEAAASHPYKFLYEDFHEYEQDIKEYLYSAENAASVVYIAHLAFEDTLADLLRQFANAEDISAYGADGTVIENLTAVLATGMMLRMMDGDTVLNQLTISVMGDIDGDGDIGTADKARLNSYTLGNLELKGASLLACDLDSDGEVGTADKARLNAYTLGNLDIYVGLILRATAQATSESVSACDEPAVAELMFSEESETTYVISAAVTESVAPIDDCESTGDCEIANDNAMEGNATSLLNNEKAFTYTAITDIKNIAFATNVYADRKRRVQFIY